MNFEQFEKIYTPGKSPTPNAWFMGRLQQGGFEEGEILKWLKRFGTDDQFGAYLNGWTRGRGFHIGPEAKDFDKVIERKAFEEGFHHATNYETKA